jgi:hypothetical protein
MTSKNLLFGFHNSEGESFLSCATGHHVTAKSDPDILKEQSACIFQDQSYKTASHWLHCPYIPTIHPTNLQDEGRELFQDVGIQTLHDTQVTHRSES